MLLGAHESAAGGPHSAIRRAVADGLESVQLFTKNNNRWQQRAWTSEEAAAFHEATAEADIPLLAHAGVTDDYAGLEEWLSSIFAL